MPLEVTPVRFCTNMCINHTPHVLLWFRGQKTKSSLSLMPLCISDDVLRPFLWTLKFIRCMTCQTIQLHTFVQLLSGTHASNTPRRKVHCLNTWKGQALEQCSESSEKTHFLDLCEGHLILSPLPFQDKGVFMYTKGVLSAVTARLCVTHLVQHWQLPGPNRMSFERIKCHKFRGRVGGGRSLAGCVNVSKWNTNRLWKSGK